MSKQFSIYLDAIRFLAAVLVFLSHATPFSGDMLWQLSYLGHESVMVFFVLSGFVISYVVFDKNENALKYTINRLTRIYSVAVPAILLTVILFYLGIMIDQELMSEISEKIRDPSWTVFSMLFFINESWISSRAFSNLAYWSLGYEVLYYAFFGVLIFSSGVKRLLLLLAVLLVMGPSIIIYLPIWMAGVLAFKLTKVTDLPLNKALFLCLISVIGIAFFMMEAPQDAVNSFVAQLIGPWLYDILLHPTAKFASDYLLTIFVALHIFSSYHVFKNVTIFNKKSEYIIRSLSAHTFSLYLFHLPMLYFALAVFPYQSNPILNPICIWILIPLTIYGISRYTESKKHRYSEFFYALFKRFGYTLNKS